THKSCQSFTIIRILFENGIGPIWTTPFTSHTLDHMLCSVLDARITSGIVMLGAFSSTERVSKHSMDEHGPISMGRISVAGVKETRQTGEEMNSLHERVFRPSGGY
ncbi:hypothetical protein BD410DRAFT_734241, partial [Rickenella mellea]